MNFAFSPEQEEFRDVLARFVEERCPIEKVRRAIESEPGYDTGAWQQMVEELGLAGIAIPEAYGGQGFSFLELGLALEQLGRNLAGGPLFATACLAAQAILNAGSEEDKQELLPAIAAGRTIATLGVAEGNASITPNVIETVCARNGGEWSVSGTKTYVINDA